MEAVADKFDDDGDGFIDYQEFIAALRPDRQPVSTCTISDLFNDFVIDHLLFMISN